MGPEVMVIRSIVGRLVAKIVKRGEARGSPFLDRRFRRLCLLRFCGLLRYIHRDPKAANVSPDQASSGIAPFSNYDSLSRGLSPRTAEKHGGSFRYSESDCTALRF